MAPPSRSTPRAKSSLEVSAASSGAAAAPSPYAAAAMLAQSADPKRALSYVPPETPRYAVPRPGQNATGLLGDAFKELPLLQRLNWIHVPLLVLTPLLAVVGCAMWTCVGRGCTLAAPRVRTARCVRSRARAFTRGPPAPRRAPSPRPAR